MEKTSLKSCPFCRIYCKNENPFFKDDKFFIFLDRKQASKFHYLASPIVHIPNVFSLRSLHKNLIQHIVQVSLKFINTQHPNTKFKIGFHAPPFTTVDHLHMHVLILPFKNEFYETNLFGFLLHSPYKIINSLENFNCYQTKEVVYKEKQMEYEPTTQAK